MQDKRYLDGSYLERHPTWDAEDSPWKADQVAKILDRNRLEPMRIAEIGCGAGGILSRLAERYPQAQLDGYEISPQAHALASRQSGPRLKYHLRDALQEPAHFDVLLALDVFEHVPDYMGFVEKCRAKATYKVYHVPLDFNASAVLRGAHIDMRHAYGHLHYFDADSALATLRDTGHEIVDFFYTAGAQELAHNVTLKRAIANVPRWLLSKMSMRFASKLLGGFSLMVLAK